MKKIYIIITVMMFMASSCVGDLDVKPLDPNIETADQTYSKEENYIRALMKIYSAYAMSGQDGIGSSDIEGLDAGEAQLYRVLWTLQVGTTDECINAWNDPWVSEINELKWTPSSDAIEGLYQRCMFVVALVNDYLGETTDDKMGGRGIRQDFWPTVHQFRNEARFVRALSYYYLMDAFGRPPFITEENYSTAPSQLSREELFNWIESELLDLAKDNSLPAPRTSYGRADKGVAYALLSRMYLNAEIYTGTNRYADCIAASKAVIGGGYKLTDKYNNLFNADNDKTSANEIIYPIVFDGVRTQSYGGIRYLIAASRARDELNIETDGLQDGWDGNRARPEFVYKFEFADNNNRTAATIKDKRGIFKDTNRSLEINEWSGSFTTQGWAIYKYSNVNADGTQGSNMYSPDTDIVLFRLGEIYLNYAEAVARGGQGGDRATALGYVNALRARGYGEDAGKISDAQMTVDFFIDERARELYWEAIRRTDLVRYGLYTSDKYLWQFKGGIKNGTAIENHRNLFPIPSSDMSVNVNLTQNEGYK